MNESFYQELERFVEHYPTLEQVVRRVFRFNATQDAQNHGTERQASLHKWEYYTPNTIRRVLQYTSIDYMLLNLSIPDWAEAILNTDDTYLV